MTSTNALDRGITAVTRWGAALRGKRLLHPAGAIFAGTFTVAPTASCGVPLLDEPGEYRVLARLSKATSTPPGRRDVLGLAWRVLDAGGPGVPLDIALSSTGRAVVARHVLTPRRDFAAATYTSLLPYRLGGRNRYLAAFPDDPARDLPADTTVLPAALAARPFALTVAVAGLTGPWRPVAALRLEQPADANPASGTAFGTAFDVAFDVVGNVLPGFAPAGWVNRLRGPAYRGSRLGRHAREPGLPGDPPSTRPG